MNEKRKWMTAGRLRRGAVILAAVGLTAGAGLAASGSALAAVGSGPGQLQLLSGTPPAVVTGGNLSDTPTWQTTTGCPTGFQAAAHVTEFTAPGGVLSTIISPNVSAGLTTGFSGTLQGNVGALLNFAGVSPTAPGTVEWAVGCFSGAGATGNVQYVQSTFVSIAAGATTYTTSSTGPVATPTATTLSASPNPAAAGATVTLTATETPATAGNVAFMNGATTIATVPVNASGVATTTFTAPSPFTSAVTLTANFSPTSTSFLSSSGTTTLNSSSVLTAVNSPVTINVTVAATGALTVTVATPATASLTVSGSSASGALPNVTISDTRNTFPGWSVSGQESTFTSSATPSTPISGNQLGWTPAAATGSNAFDGTHVLLGGAVAPASPGLGTTAAVLALAHAGFGADPTGATSWIATAALNLAIPASTTAGAYTGSLAITYLSSQA